MDNPTGNQGFFSNRIRMISFMVSMLAVVVFFLVIKPALVKKQGQPPVPDTGQPAQEASSPGTMQPGEGFQEGDSFTAASSLPTDLLRVGDEAWVLADEALKLYRPPARSRHLTYPIPVL